MVNETLNNVAGSKPIELLESGGLTTVAGTKAAAGGAATIPVLGTSVPEVAVVATAGGLAVVGGYNFVRHGYDLVNGEE